eukprot:9208722-Pyramimonas_sp.AAC.1
MSSCLAPLQQFSRLSYVCKQTSVIVQPPVAREDLVWELPLLRRVALRRIRPDRRTDWVPLQLEQSQDGGGDGPFNNTNLIFGQPTSHICHDP